MNFRPLPYQGSALPLSYGSAGHGHTAQNREPKVARFLGTWGPATQGCRAGLALNFPSGKRAGASGEPPPTDALAHVRLRISPVDCRGRRPHWRGSRMGAIHARRLGHVPRARCGSATIGKAGKSLLFRGLDAFAPAEGREPGTARATFELPSGRGPERECATVTGRNPNEMA